MIQRNAALAIVLSCGLIATSLCSPANAQGIAKPSFSELRASRAQAAGDSAMTRLRATRASANPNRTVAVMIELEDEPAALIYVRQRELGAVNGPSAARAQAVDASSRHASRIKDKQRALARTLRSPGFAVTEICRVHRAYNGIAVNAPIDKIDDIAKLPGVKAVHRLVPKSLALADSVEFSQAPEFWTGLPGSTGAGVSIGIIDTGIDYLHKDFGAQAFPNAKVVGGYDFAGDDYNGENTPVPDSDPMDAHGHGTHVAGIAAGFGVTSSGDTFSGPYDATVPFGSMAVAPGIAPEAQIYALKIFGRSGSSSLVVQAIDWALDPNGDDDMSDHLDVINMSLGSPFGDLSDPDLIASNNAASVGMIVVASAGNSSDTYYSTGSPGAAQRAINVASSLDDSLSSLADTLSSFSARGPAMGASMLKPDISAPGQSIRSAALGTVTGASRRSGTSMAAPHVAGAMALLRALHPDWTVEELKALLMNTAGHDLFVGLNQGPPKYCATRAGSGRMGLARAWRASSVAYCYEDAGAVSVSFGDIEVLDQTTLRKSIEVWNTTGAQIQYDLAYSSVSDASGVEISFPKGASLIVPGQGRAAFEVELTATAAAMSHPRASALTIEQGGIPRHWLTEECGLITITPAGGESLRVPLQALARPSGAVTATNADIPIAGGVGTVVLNLQGASLNTGTNYPFDEIGLISPCELHAISPNDPETSGREDMGDLRYVGARIYRETPGVENTDVIFSVATHGDWDTPNSPIEFDIFIDSNRDGTDDYWIFNWNDGEFQPDPRSKPSDVFVSVVTNLTTEFSLWGDFINGFPGNTIGGGSATTYDTYPMNTNALTMSVPARMIGLDDDNSRFNYRVESYNLLTGEVVDSTPTLTYDAASPGFDFPFFTYFATDGNTITTDFSRPALDANNCLGVLLIHHHNTAGNRAQAISIQYASSKFWEQYK